MAISFNGLGNEGRLGNQLFQYAFIRGLASNCNLEWTIPGPESTRYDNYGLFECFELYGCKNVGEKIILQLSTEAQILMNRFLILVKTM